MFKLFEVIVNHWAVQLVAGVVLLASVVTDYLELTHGIFGFAVWHLAKTTPDIVQALERVVKGDWKRGNKS